MADDRKIFSAEIEVPDIVKQKADDAFAKIKMEGANQMKSRKKFINIKKNILLKVAVFCICLITTVGTSAVAAINYVQERMQSMTEENKKMLTDTVQQSSANIDAYSRNLYEDELEKFEKLQSAYLSEGLFPQKDLPIVETVNLVPEGTVAFATKESTFVIPERTLTDEEILEMIDFYYKRDYSLQEKCTDMSPETYDLDEETKKDAIDKSLSYIKNFYGVDAKDYQIDIETDPNNIYRLQFSSDRLDGYNILYDVTEKEITEIEYCSNTEIQDESISIDNTLFAEKGTEILDNIRAINRDGDITEIYCDYTTSDNKKLERNIVSYIFRLENGNCYVAKYNFNVDKMAELLIVPYECYQKTIDDNVSKLERRGIQRVRVNISD